MTLHDSVTADTCCYIYPESLGHTRGGEIRQYWLTDCNTCTTLICVCIGTWFSVDFIVQFSRSVVSEFLCPRALQHARLPCP